MVGRTLGRYRIVEKLGAGAMGEVYRAHDTTLARDVAIKVLPSQLMADPDRRTRLAREARVLASLNHPNVGAIYGFEETDGISALVLELIEGPTLADRLASGAMPVNEAIGLARQIAQALDAAHERGIIHRDLKPANIKLAPSGVVKVFDFGLAKASDHGAFERESDELATAAVNATQRGTILGTVAYMSPEQARGQATDKRTDIWAFGCVLYEMLTGQAAFGRGTITDTLAAVVEREPLWTALPASTPASVRRLLARCFEKDAKRRLRDIGDARIDLDDADDQAMGARPPATRTIGVAIAVASVLVGLAAGWFVASRGSTPATAAVDHWMLDVRPAEALLSGVALERDILGRWRPSRTAIALAPDGRTIAFTALREGRQAMYLRAFDRPDATEIPGTEGATNPFFSPDGAWIGYWSDGALRKVPASGGPAAKLCETPTIYGASWGDDDRIVFGRLPTIWRVPASGGTPEELTKRPPGGGEARHLLPQVLPGGKWLLFTLQITINEWEGSRIVAQSLATGERKTILEGAADARYVSTGHLVFMRFGTLTAAPFDAERLELKGAEVAIVPNVMQSLNSGTPVALDTGAGQYAFSSSGTLVYVEGGINDDPVNTLQWLRRDGSTETIPAPGRPYFLPRLSPDERQLLVGTAGMRDQNLWRYDLAGRTLTRLTTEGRAEQGIWSRDGSQIAFAASLKGFQQLFVTRSDGGVPPRQLTDGDAYFPGAWTPDNQSLVVAARGDIELMSLADRKVQPIVQTRFRENMPDLSPDGRWLAYVSNETGRLEVYVQAFPSGTGKRLISTDGGTEPLWSRNGRKLIFIADSSTDQKNLRTLTEVDVTTGTQFTAGSPHALFNLDIAHYGGASQTHSYDTTADAQRFLFVYETYPQTGSHPRELHLVQNWFAELKQRVTR